MKEKIQVWLYSRKPKEKWEFLLLHTRPERGAFWQPITGGVEPAESLKAAALREAREETGIAFSNVPVPFGYTFRFISQRNLEPVEETCFALELSPAEAQGPIVLDPREHDRVLFANAAEAQSLLHYPTNQEALSRLLRWLEKSAPDFALPNQDGQEVRLSELVARGPVLLIFYPGDFTPVCTRQLCQYQGNIEVLRDRGIQVIGISPDSPEKHRLFKMKYSLDFPLLSDPKKTVFDCYGVKSRWLLGMTSRAVFLVNPTLEVIYKKIEKTALTYPEISALIKAIDRSEEKA